MTAYEFGDVLLLKVFPYSHLAEAKKRPALVMADTGDQDILVARITSEAPRDAHDLPLAHWKEAGLLVPSVVRLSKLATLSKGFIIKKMGRLGSPERRKIKRGLKELFDIS